MKKYALGVAIGSLFCISQVEAMNFMKKKGDYTVFKHDVQQAMHKIAAETDLGTNVLESGLVVVFQEGDSILIDTINVNMLVLEAKTLAIDQGLNLKSAADIVVSLLINKAKQDVKLSSGKAKEIEKDLHKLVYDLFKIK